jgi:hypothetical protein
MSADIDRRIWSAQSKVLLPMIDSARRGIIRAYMDEATFKQHDATLRQRYVAVCQALVRLHTMRITARAALPASRPLFDPDPLIAAVASGQVQAEIDADPRLIVFGFDGDQRDGRWERDAKRLRDHQPSLNIRAIGNTRSAREFF